MNLSGAVRNTRHSCNIRIYVHILSVSGQVLLFYQPRDALFDDAHLRDEMALDSINCRRLELLVGKFLASFHDAHDSCIEVVLSVSLNGRAGRDYTPSPWTEWS